jgi:NADPH:quinone reductase-like Zn-dependent oxidoreductase
MAVISLGGILFSSIVLFQVSSSIVVFAHSLPRWSLIKKPNTAPTGKITMEALALKKELKPEEQEDYSYKNVLEFTNLPLLQCQKPFDVLIQVCYSDVNPVDLQKLAAQKTRRADVVLYRTDGSGYPFITGYGGTGIVVAVGEKGPRNLLGKEVCFLGDPSRPGSYATHVVTDGRCVVELPPKVSLRDAACVPVAGLTAYESLAQVGLASHVLLGSGEEEGTLSKVGSTTNDVAKLSTTATPSSLLIVGGSGGVGSWCILLARAFYPHLQIFATASHEDNQKWCQKLGATKVLGHDEIGRVFKGGPEGSIDAIICLTEPTPALFNTMAEVIKPYGNICLVVAGNSIKNLDLGFCFFKNVTVHTQTVFSSIRTDFKIIRPADELEVILSLLNSQQIQAPLSPALDDKEKLSEKFKQILEDNGILHRLAADGRTTPKCGKLVICINSGRNLILVDIKTASLISMQYQDCIEQKIVTPVEQEGSNGANNAGGNKQNWKESVKGGERDSLMKLLKDHPTLGILPAQFKKITDDYHDVTLQESENVKKLWGVSLKKRETNKKGEELLFVDPRTDEMGELSRNDAIEKKILTIRKDDDGNEIVLENIQEESDRDDIIHMIRKSLKLLGD